MKNNKFLDFDNTDFYIGIDVHKKSWKISVNLKDKHLKSFSMDPSPKTLAAFMQKNYPYGIYHSVYEAGFCGFHIHEELTKLGFHNIIVSAADVPSSSKERAFKTDAIDCMKLARELSNGKLKCIYIPDKYSQEFRGLVRRREDLTHRQSNIKKKIKSCLMFYGIETPDEFSHWSGNYINWLKTIHLRYKVGDDNLAILLEELSFTKKLISTTLKSIRREYKSNNELKKLIDLLTTIPGIGFITAITLYSELIEINRFKKTDELPSYVGLVPSVSSSGEKEHTNGLTNRHNSHLRNLIIEAAWVAIRADPALTMAYAKFVRRMVPQKAIIRIAKKLLFRVRHVWQYQTEYRLAVVA